MDIKLQTIKSKKTFSFLFENGKKFFETNSMTVFYFVMPETDFLAGDGKLTVNYAVTVPKKFAKKAVVRNRIKRLMRESVRHFFISKIDSDFPCKELSVVFIWRNTPKHPMLIGLRDVQPEIEKHLRTALEFCKKEKTKA